MALVENRPAQAGHRKLWERMPGSASERLALATLDGVSAHIAVVDQDGTILTVNQSWRDFAAANSPDSAGLCEGANYLGVCAAAKGPASAEAPAFLSALLAVLAGESTAAAVEYPCHSPSEECWFVARITRFPGSGPAKAIVSHENITRYKLMEKALRDSEAHYRSLFENNHSVMLLIDGNGGAIIDANPAAVTYYGWPREQLKLMRIGEINTLSATEVQAEMNCAASEQRNCFLFKHRLADGSIRDVEVFSGPVSISGRSLLYSIVHDITDRKQAENALVRSEAALRKSQAVAHVGHWIWDVDTHAITWSDEVKRIFGLDPAAYGNLPHAMVDHAAHPDDAGRLHAILDSFIEDGQQAVDAEYRVVWPDGSIHYAWNMPAERTVDAQGHTVQFLGVVQDVTEHKREELERERLLLQLRDQADRLALVMRSVPEGVLLLGTDWQVLLANPYAESLLALLATYDAGCDAEKRLTHLGSVGVESLLAGPARGQWYTLHRLQRTFELVGSPVQSGQGDAGWVLVIRDVTAEHALQEQLQRQERLAAVGQLAAGIAHDFNNIMSVISIYAELLGEAPSLSAKDRERAATIGGQALRATSMIRQILDFSRRSVFERNTFDLLPLLKEQEKLLKQTLRENIEIELSYERGEYWVMADPTRIQQLVMNLAVNARDAMAEGGKLRLELDHLSITADQWAAYPGVKPGGWLRLSVTDTGTGIAPEHLPRIFEPFFTTKETGKGTGLGLAQAHGIVAQHDGQILVASTPGVGTRFTILLPAQEVPLPQADGRRIHARVAGHGERVLLVEDDDILRDSLADRLAHWNYQVSVAANGEDALALLSRSDTKVDLIISDVIMPRLGGIGLLQALRQQGVNTSMILLSGHPRGEDPNDVESLGLCAWLTKPPQSEELAKAVEQALVFQQCI